MAPMQVRMGACLLRNHLTHEGAPTSTNEGLLAMKVVWL